MFRERQKLAIEWKSLENAKAALANRSEEELIALAASRKGHPGEIHSRACYHCGYREAYQLGNRPIGWETEGCPCCFNKLKHQIWPPRELTGSPSSESKRVSRARRRRVRRSFPLHRVS